MGAVFSGMLYAFGVMMYWLRIHRLIIWWNRRNPKVLLYHACEESESAFTRGLRCSITPVQFKRQLDFLMRHYQVVSVATIQDQDVPNYAVAITFDDGYQSVYEHAYPALKSRQLPATLYLITDVVGNRKLVWVNELNWLMRTCGKEICAAAVNIVGLDPDATPDEVIAVVQARFNKEAIRKLLADLRTLAGVDVDAICRDSFLYVDWDQIDEMGKYGFGFGNHSMSHPNLTALGENEQREEIVGAHAVLTERLGGADSLSYPFGYHDETTVSLAKELGYRSLMEVGGTNLPLNPLHVARVPVRAGTVAGLFSQMELVEPIKGLFRRLLGR
jgi:peptidoglycan/xylan/chitin deacetylase (PgdA/CDA1 family)